ncbi:hypothetical protein [Ruminococcus bromii]|jgi:hypothetical protein|uniref:hypothetical protein n=1 Tax=Ruminococcus bromii TaxID=40518 RepID=UPI00266DB3AD|nr:hypothetical protein [Ruminococcus bromii]
MEKNNLEMCISCPIAHIFISEYRKIKNYTKEEKKTISKNDKKEYKIKIEISVKKLSQLLGIKLKNMSSIIAYIMKRKSEFEMGTTTNILSKMCCINCITSIIDCFDTISENSESLVTDLRLFDKDDIKLFVKLEKFLKRNNIVPQNPLTKDEKSWSDDFMNLIYENEDVAEDTYYKFSDLIDDYVTPPSNISKYDCCDKIYKNNSLLSDKSIDEFTNCIDRLNEPFKEELQKQTRMNKINEILNHESNILKSIMCRYLEKAEKNQKKILDFLMKKQGITDTNIAIILYKDPNKKTEIENWHKIKDNSTELPPKAKLHLQELLNILLVSEDVLRCGTGKIYGNWENAINENKNEKFKDALLTSDDMKEIEKTKISPHRRPSLKTKERIYDRIRTFINPSENDLNKMISENPEFFCEEDFCVFTYEKDGEEYFDYELMCENLLHPEDFDTLLSVLEELQAEKNS